MESDPEPDQPPWWGSDDEAYAGATPLFDGAKRGGSRQSDDSASATTATDSGVGSAISEGLKLAAALSAWSNASGLTDTLRTIATEAGEALATLGPHDTAHSGTTTGEGTAADFWAEGAPPADPADTGTPATDEPHVGTPTDDSAANAHTQNTQDVLYESACDYCPLCRGIDVMRVVQPHMARTMAESMASLTSALDFALESLASRNQPHGKQT